MESEPTSPPAKKLCTETTAVNKKAESNVVDKSAKLDCASEPAITDYAGKNGGSGNETAEREKDAAPGNETVPQDKTTSVSETVDEVPVGSQRAENGESKTGDKQTAAVIPNEKAENKTQVKDSKASTGKVTSQTQRGGKQNGLEANNRLPTKPIDHVDLSRVIEGIQVCDYEIEEMTISANQKVVEIERALRESKKPVYYKRSNLIQHIPEFWLTTLINHHHISHFINEADEDCLQYLRKLHVEEFDESVSGFKISFVFEVNPYFENEVLCKEISYGASGVLRSKATPIRWKPGHDLTRVTEASASSSKSMPQSFFHWFLQNSNPVQDKVAVFIRDDIWPNPLKYFQVHTEDSSIDVSSDGIIVDSSGDEEDDDVMVLEDSRDADFDDLDDEDIELLENEEELLDEDEFDSEEEDLLMEDDEDELDDDELMLIESRGPPPRQQKNPVKKMVPLARVGPSKAPPTKGVPVSSKVPPASAKAPPTPARATSSIASPTVAPQNSSRVSRAAPPKEPSGSQGTRTVPITAKENCAKDNTTKIPNQTPSERGGEGASGDAKRDSAATGEGTVLNKETTDVTGKEGTAEDAAGEVGTVAVSAEETGTAEPPSAVTVKS